jgi:hypothetical protein
MVTMPQLSSRQASVYAAVVFLITIVLGFSMPGYSITLSGLLVVIFPFGICTNQQRNRYCRPCKQCGGCRLYGMEHMGF